MIDFFFFSLFYSFFLRQKNSHYFLSIFFIMVVAVLRIFFSILRLVSHILVKNVPNFLYWHHIACILLLLPDAYFYHLT